ncbi:MAG TPA: ankyrin repeat domain-containing protein [Candidatus Binatia bacterium]
MIRKGKRGIVIVAPLVLLVIGCWDGPKQARKELWEFGIRWNQQTFLESVEDSDAVIVELFLRAGMNPDMTNEWGWTPLMHAALAGHTGVARSLMAAGAAVNTKGEGGLTALSLAAGVGQTEVVKLLLGAAAEVNITDAEGWTALMYASERGYADVVKALAERHADIDARNKEGRTALNLAESQGHTEVVDILRQAGASGGDVPHKTRLRAWAPDFASPPQGGFQAQPMGPGSA